MAKMPKITKQTGMLSDLSPLDADEMTTLKTESGRNPMGKKLPLPKASAPPPVKAPKPAPPMKRK